MAESIRIIAIVLGVFGVLITIGAQIMSGEWSKGADLLDVAMLGGVGAIMLVGAILKLPFGWYAGLLFGAYGFLEPLLTRRRKQRAGKSTTALKLDTVECVVGALFVASLVTAQGRQAFGL